ncbi:MAG: CocE/NonD family hydrolase [Granulosicoccus sp.]
MDPIYEVFDFPRRVREIENTWIPLPDGTRLAVRIWLPDDAEQYPVPAILEYLPYRKRDGTVARDHLTHPYFAGHGYAGVRVDMRGTGDSEGVCLGEYLLQEQEDALVVIEWLASQPWCSGKVGMVGISWGGFNGLQLAARQPQALAAVITLCSTDDRYADDIHFMGGCLLTEKLAWGATAFSIANTPPDPVIVGDRWRDMWQQRIDNNGLWMLDWFRHQRRDSFYEHGSVCEDYSAINIPVYAVGGWADGYTNSVFRLLENLHGACKGLIGPWCHKYPHFASPGPRIGFLQECLRWWDQHLKGIDTGIMSEPKLRAWIQEPTQPSANSQHRTGRWISEQDWPAAARTYWTLYLNDSTLAERAGNDTVIVDSPQNAGWTMGSWCGYGDGDAAIDQNGERGLMTLFESAPLADAIDLFGFPVFHATASSNTEQANIAVILSAINADGSATQLSYGVLNLTHQHSHSEPSALIPDKPKVFTVQLNALGQRVEAGQRVRLALSTACWPLIWPSQGNSRLSISPGTARIELPLRTATDETLPPFQQPEGAQALQTETLRAGEHYRLRKIDYLTGHDLIERYNDTGMIKHLHTGTSVQNISRETFTIDPADANSAKGCCEWTKRYTRDDWHAELVTSVTVEALARVWRIKATLVASDAEGIVTQRKWSEDIERDLV